MEEGQDRLVKSWRKAARELGVEVRGPLTVTIGNGDLVACDMLVPFFGSFRGTVVFTEFQDDLVVDKLYRDGYCCSTFGPIPDGYEDAKEGVAEVLVDWGWCGPEELKPSWLVQR